MNKQPFKTSQQHLFEIAVSQQGLFTNKQATAAGFSEKNHSYHLKAGNWIREYRGIYRLAHFPYSDNSDYVLWSLWSRNQSDSPQGIFSHETALNIYDLSDIMPSKIHMTVPKGFRKGAAIPKVLVLHPKPITPEASREMQGYRVTTPLRTVIDLIEEKSVSRDIIRQAIDEGMQRGLITKTEIEQAMVSKAVRQELNQLIGRPTR